METFWFQVEEQKVSETKRNRIKSKVRNVFTIHIEVVILKCMKNETTADFIVFWVVVINLFKLLENIKLEKIFPKKLARKELKYMNFVGRSYASLPNIYQHMPDHDTERAPVLVCPECGAFSKNGKNLKAHMRRSHPI